MNFIKALVGYRRVPMAIQPQSSVIVDALAKFIQSNKHESYAAYKEIIDEYEAKYGESEFTRKFRAVLEDRLR